MRTGNKAIRPSTKGMSRYTGSSKRIHRGYRQVTDFVRQGNHYTNHPGIISNGCYLRTSNVFPAASMPIDGSFGVDKLVINVPLVEEGIDTTGVLVHVNNTDPRSDQAVWHHPATGVAVNLKVERKSCSLRIEFNPSRFYDPYGYTLCPPGAVKKVVQVLLEELVELGIPRPTFTMDPSAQEYLDTWEQGWESEIWVSVVDIARDFTTDPDEFDMSWLQDTRAKHSKATVTYRNKGQVQTICSSFKSARGNCKLYDKHEETKRRHKKDGRDIAPKGTFRFEATIKTRKLRKFSIHTVADLHQDRIEAAARQEWENSQMGTAFQDPRGWINRICASSLSESEKTEVLAYLCMRDYGLQDRYSDTDSRRLSKLARQGGLNLRQPLSKQSGNRRVLHFDKGEIESTSAVQNGLVHETMETKSINDHADAL